MVRLRWLIVGGWVVVLVGAGVGLAPRAAGVLVSGGFYVPDAESTQAATVLDRDFNGANRNNISVVFTFPDATVDDPQIKAQLTDADARLAAVAGVRHIDSFAQTGSPLLV